MSDAKSSHQIDALEVARRFIDLVLREPEPSVERLQGALDELAFAYHFSTVTDPTDDDEEVEPPGYPDGLYHAVAERFPDLGLYSISDPTILEAKELMVGDAIDDLADILRDLMEVVWRAENQSEQDARWYFRLLFQIHWGRHLRKLSWYLHDKQWG
jgi:hypothetical protein